jgi:hypothetical protein
VEVHVSKHQSTHRRHKAAATQRAKKILEIKPGTVTVYTAYLVVAIRLLVLVVHTVVPGLQ